MTFDLEIDLSPLLLGRNMCCLFIYILQLKLHYSWTFQAEVMDEKRHILPKFSGLWPLGLTFHPYCLMKFYCYSYIYPSRSGLYWWMDGWTTWKHNASGTLWGRGIKNAILVCLVISNLSPILYSLEDFKGKNCHMQGIQVKKWNQGHPSNIPNLSFKECN